MPGLAKGIRGALLLTLLAFTGACVSPVPPARTTPAPIAANKGVRTVILVRHGAYDEDDARDPFTGKGLTVAGRQQARLTGERLAALPGRVDAVYASPMTRARETAEIAGRSLGRKVTLDPDLVEGGPPITDPKNPGRKVADEEAACAERLEKVFARYFQPSPDRNTTVVLVCHGNVIRYLWSRALQVDPGIWQRYRTSNCNVTEVRINPDGSMRGVSYNDVGHLPPELRTFSWRSPMYRP